MMTNATDAKYCAHCGVPLTRRPKESYPAFGRRAHCGAVCRKAVKPLTCTVEGCLNAINAGALCSGHYQRMRRTGVVGGSLRDQDSGRPSRLFWGKVDRSAGPDACWPWTRRVNSNGYGDFRIYRGAGPKGYRRVLAHRYAYMESTGEDIVGKILLHRCDNPPCCNPSHLRVGTQADNMRDAAEKGRLSPPPVLRGSRNRLATLTEGDVALIHARLAAGEVQSAIARDFGVTPTVVSRIKLGKSWVHVHPTRQRLRESS
jgi:HNH endonuclease